MPATDFRLPFEQPIFELHEQINTLEANEAICQAIPFQNPKQVAPIKTNNIIRS